jgi:hypothetical protein
VPGTAEFFSAQPDYRGDAAGCGDCGGEAVQRVVDHGVSGDGSFWVPGNVTQEMMSFVANQLIQQGAKLVTNA